MHDSNLGTLSLYTKCEVDESFDAIVVQIVHFKFEWKHLCIESCHSYITYYFKYVTIKRVAFLDLSANQPLERSLAAHCSKPLIFLLCSFAQYMKVIMEDICKEHDIVCDFGDRVTT